MLYIVALRQPIRLILRAAAPIAALLFAPLLANWWGIVHLCLSCSFEPVLSNCFKTDYLYGTSAVVIVYLTTLNLLCTVNCPYEAEAVQAGYYSGSTS